MPEACWVAVVPEKLAGMAEPPFCCCGAKAAGCPGTVSGAGEGAGVGAGEGAGAWLGEGAGAAAEG
jgi:hypothetical protein